MAVLDFIPFPPRRRGGRKKAPLKKKKKSTKAQLGKKQGYCNWKKVRDRLEMASGPRGKGKPSSLPGRKGERYVKGRKSHQLGGDATVSPSARTQTASDRRQKGLKEEKTGEKRRENKEGDVVVLV